MVRQDYWVLIYCYELVCWIKGSGSVSFWQNFFLYNIFLNFLVVLFYVVGIRLSDQLVSILLLGRIFFVWFFFVFIFGVFFYFGYWVIFGIIFGLVLGLVLVFFIFDLFFSIV